MKKIVFIFSICFSVCILNIQGASALQSRVISSESKVNVVQPRAIETYTISHDMGIADSDGSSITWKATITYNPRESKMILTNMTATSHFSYTRPTWYLKSWSCKPTIGSNVLHDDYVNITYTIHTVGTADKGGVFKFQLY